MLNAQSLLKNQKLTFNPACAACAAEEAEAPEQPPAAAAAVEEAEAPEEPSVAAAAGAAAEALAMAGAAADARVLARARGVLVRQNGFFGFSGGTDRKTLD